MRRLDMSYASNIQSLRRLSNQTLHRVQNRMTHNTRTAILVLTSPPGRLPLEVWSPFNPRVTQAVFGTLLGLEVISTCMRLYTRRIMMVARRWMLEDLLAVLALLGSISGTGISIAFFKNNMLNPEVATLDQITLDLRILYAIRLLYTWTLWNLKFSILCFYNRLFIQRKLLIKLTGVYLGLTMFASFLTQCLYCLPIEMNFVPLEFAKCGPNTIHATIVYFVFNITTDGLIMLIPLSTLHQLRINRRKKLGLTFLFALGTFAMIASTIRTVISITNPTSIPKILVWSAVEVTVSFIVTNGPALRPLLPRSPCGLGHDSDHSDGALAPAIGQRGRGLPGMDSYDQMVKNHKMNVVTVKGGKDASVEEKHTLNSPLSSRGSQISVTKTVQVSIQSDPEEDDHNSVRTDLSTSTTRKSAEV